MVHDVSPTPGATPAATSPGGETGERAVSGVLGTATGVLGSLYAMLAGFAVGGLEAWSDHRAEARVARAGRPVDDGRRRLRRANRGPRHIHL